MYFAENEAMMKILETVLTADNRANEVGVVCACNDQYMAECHLQDYYIGSLSLVVGERGGE